MSPVTRHIVRQPWMALPPPVPITPTTVPGLVAWYDASDLATITQSGGFVSQLNDKSGNGYHLTQSTGGNQPQTGINSQNGLNLLTFAADDVLSRSTTPTWSSAPAMLLVCSMAASLQQWWTQVQTGTDMIFGRGLAGTDYQNLWLLGSGGQITSNFTDIPMPLSVIAGYFGASGSGYLRRNGVALGGSTVTISGSGLNIGRSAAGPTGDFAEGVFYDPGISDNDRNGLESYFFTRWGLP